MVTVQPPKEVRYQTRHLLLLSTPLTALNERKKRVKKSVESKTMNAREYDTTCASFHFASLDSLKMIRWSLIFHEISSSLGPASS